MTQHKCRSLAVTLACPADVVVGDPVDIASDLTVAGLSSVASVNQVGYVEKHQALATEATIVTWLKRRLWGVRHAAAELPVGPFVLDAANKAVAFSPDDLVRVTGSNTGPFNITVEVAGTTSGDVAGPVSIADAINNQLTVTVGSGEPQTLGLTPGAAVAMADIAEDINASAVGFTATVDGEGHLVLTADDVADALEIVAVAGDCYTTLGLTAAVYPVTLTAGVVVGTSAGPCAIADAINNQLTVTVGTGEPQTIGLTPGAAVAMADIATDINTTAVGFTATVDGGGHIVLTADDPADGLEVVAVTGDCYTALGLTAAVYAAVACGGRLGRVYEPRQSDVRGRGQGPEIARGVCG